jgi:hypothetical protein
MSAQVRDDGVLPVLSAQSWRDLEQISSEAVDRAIEAASKRGSAANLANAIHAGCAIEADFASRAETVVRDYLDQKGATLEVVTAWIDACVAGPMGDDGSRIPPPSAGRLLAEMLSKAVKQTDEHAIALVEKLIERGADAGLRDQENVSAGNRRDTLAIQNAVRSTNVLAVELIIGKRTVFDASHPLPYSADTDDSPLSLAVGVLASKTKEGAELFRMIASHLAPGYEEPYHRAFDLYARDRLFPTCHPTSVLSFARGLMLGVRPYPDREEESWRQIFGLQISTPAAYPGSNKSHGAPFAHALIAADNDDDLGAILRHLHKHGWNPEQGFDSANVTPLVHAAAKGKKSAVEALLEMGANTSVKVVAFDPTDASKWLTPAEVATACGHEEIARMILSHSAKRAIDQVVSKNEPGGTRP